MMAGPLVRDKMVYMPSTWQGTASANEAATKMAGPGAETGYSMGVVDDPLATPLAHGDAMEISITYPQDAHRGHEPEDELLGGPTRGIQPGMALHCDMRQDVFMNLHLAQHRCQPRAGCIGAGQKGKEHTL